MKSGPDVEVSEMALVCGICGEPIADQDRTIVTAFSTLHVVCVERSAAAA